MSATIARRDSRDPGRSGRLFAALLAAIAAVSLGAAAETLKPGSASGTFAAGGKDVKIAFSAAFTDQGDERKPVILILSDKEVPASKWKTSSDMSSFRREHPFLGVAFWIDKKNEVFRTDYYDGTPFPTSASGIFELKLERKGDALSGSAKSNAAAAKLTEPVKLDASFNAALK